MAALDMPDVYPERRPWSVAQPGFGCGTPQLDPDVQRTPSLEMLRAAGVRQRYPPWRYHWTESVLVPARCTL